ncbi:MAG TPA: outer membrane protein assembly factor BamB [Limnobacter sp.]|uniref:outer membrane protein assembly factor BamB n=1 Tax=Limnobacter sp. TaxID=2003368 RepID=UPI002ED96DCD
MKQVMKYGCVAMVSLVLGGCSTMSSMVNAINPFSSSKVRPAELAQFKPELAVNTRWSVDVGDSEKGYFTPVVYGSTVYAASQEGKVYAVDKASGKVRWSVKLDSKLKSGVGVTADTVAVVDANNQLVALDGQGKPKWKVPLAVDSISVPVGTINSILIRGIDFSVNNYASDNGALRWAFTRQLPPLTLRINSTVDVNNARVYAGFPGGRLLGVDLNNGAQVWEGVLASPSGTTEIERITDVTGSPVYNFREVCAASFQGRVGCLDAVNGRSIWSTEFSSPNGASVDDRYVIASNELGDLFAFSRSGGKQVWRVANFQRRQPTAPLAVGRAVAIGDYEGYVHFIDRDTGKTIARTQVGSSAFSSNPQPGDSGELVVQSRKGKLALLSVQ